MCGICGIFLQKHSKVNQETLERMTQSMSHRGPDGMGTFVSSQVLLGHRRLSIIDIDGGSQPMSNKEENLQLVFNGEIYNYLELREELLCKGHCFTTTSDTEVILHAYEEWSTDCLKYFNGIFSFALYDIKASRLFLARDHLGIKPLYHSHTSQGDFLFASEIKALLKHPDITAKVNITALGDLFTYRYVPSPQTLFKGINKLPPGHYLTFDGKNTEIVRYWSFIPQNIFDRSERDLITDYQDLLEDSIRLQLRSDVPVGLFLSSGIDSGSILSIMRENTGNSIHTFTIGFEGGEKTNELDGAEELSKRFGSVHHKMIVSPNDYLNYFQRYISDIEEPVGNETAAAFYFVSLLAQEEVKVALSGQGADEPWAGYHRHLGAMYSSHYSRLPDFFTRSIERIVLNALPRNERIKRGVIALSESDLLKRFQKIYAFFTDDMKAKLYQEWLSSTLSQDTLSGADRFRHLLQDMNGRDPLSQILYLDTRTNLPDDLLMVGDKTTMANSLEMRVPFLDHRLVEFVENLSPRMKIKGFTGKYLHKLALKKYLPEDIIRKKKKGFANPISNWLRKEMFPFLCEMLLSDDSRVQNYFNLSYINNLIRLHESGKEQYTRHLYLLLSFEMWHRTFIDPTN